MLVNIIGVGTDLVHQFLQHVVELMRGGTSCDDLDACYCSIDKKDRNKTVVTCYGSAAQ